MSIHTLNVLFSGGPLDGELMLNFPRKRLGHLLNMRRDAYFGTTDSDAVAIYKGKLNSSWFYYLSDVYEVKSMSDNKETVTYRFTIPKEVHRCTAFTLKGKRCTKEAKDGQLFCSEKHKPWTNPSLIKDPLDLSNIVMPTGAVQCK
jgi:hypothetical protein